MSSGASPGIRLLGLFGYWLLRLQCATWQVEVHGMPRVDDLLASGGRVMLVFWHGGYVPLFALLQGRDAVIFTSDSFRGRVIGEISRRFGYRCLPLPSRRGRSVLVFMQSAMEGHRIVALAADGPLGPGHVVKSGVLRLASSLGCAMIPAAVAGRRRRVNSRRWDRREVPALFTRVVLVVGEPLIVPPALTAAALEQWRRRAASAIDTANRQAAVLARRAD